MMSDSTLCKEYSGQELNKFLAITNTLIEKNIDKSRAALASLNANEINRFREFRKWFRTLTQADKSKLTKNERLNQAAYLNIFFPIFSLL